jgi:hypothetical protein
MSFENRKKNSATRIKIQDFRPNRSIRTSQSITMRYLSVIVLSVCGVWGASGYSITPPGKLHKNGADIQTVQHVAGGVLDRKDFLLSTAAMLAIIGSVPTVANAGYGDGTTMELPNYIEFLIEKNKSVDPSEFLYKGADPGILLKRLLGANTKLAEIPKLAEEKKWSQVQGILTGPLGSLAETLNLICKQGGPEVQAAGKKIKSDLIAIGQAATKKDGKACIDGAKQTTADLETFVKTAFQ